MLNQYEFPYLFAQKLESKTVRIRNLTLFGAKMLASRVHIAARAAVNYIAITTQVSRGMATAFEVRSRPSTTSRHLLLKGR